MQAPEKIDKPRDWALENTPMGRRIVQVPPGFHHPTDEAGEPIPGAHLEPLWDMPAERLTCLQVYEDVSEGTPVSPVFESSDQLLGWLIAQGVSDRAAVEFLRQGSIPSFVLWLGGEDNE
jgi:hypothetical protein